MQKSRKYILDIANRRETIYRIINFRKLRDTTFNEWIACHSNKTWYDRVNHMINDNYWRARNRARR